MLILNVRRLNKNIKVFVLADRDLSEEKTRIMDYGADEFTVKPISMETLTNKVNLQLLEAAKSTCFSFLKSLNLSLFHGVVKPLSPSRQCIYPLYSRVETA
jgi:DNA-binding response OmpR family regulator